MENNYNPANEIYVSFRLEVNVEKKELKRDLTQNEMDKYFFFREER